MEFKVEKKSIRVTIGDKSYEMNLPNVKQSKLLKKELAEAEPGDAVEVMSKYIVALGLPENVVDELDYDTFLDLYSFVHSSKKNLPATT